MSAEIWNASILCCYKLSSEYFFYFSGSASASAVPSLTREFYASSASVAKQELDASGVEQIQVLEAVEDLFEGVIVEMKETMDPDSFSTLLRDSLSVWRRLVLLASIYSLSLFFFSFFISNVYHHHHHHHLTAGKERCLD